MQWTLMAPFIASCPASNPTIQWQNFPALFIQNNPDVETVNNSNVVGENNLAAVSNNLTVPLSFPGRQVQLVWELPGMSVGPNGSFTTTTSAGQARVCNLPALLLLLILTICSLRSGFLN